MSFLKRFEGKTQTINKQQITQILGNKHKTSKTPQITSKTPIIMQKSQKINLSLKKINESKSNTTLQKNVNVKIKNNSTANQQNNNNKKTIIQNPFLVQNNFYLSEQEHQKIIKVKKEKEVQQQKQREAKEKQERKQRERLKKLQLQRKMQEEAAMKKSVVKGPYVPPIKNRQWVKLGGLGPNVGGDQWTKKKDLQDKMLKFAQEIKKINLQRTKSLKPRTSLRNQIIPDARTLALAYSKSIPKPIFYQLQRSNIKNTSNYYSQELNQINNQQEQNFNQNELKSYQRQHQRYKSLVDNQF